jgi:hypothetical protein
MSAEEKAVRDALAVVNADTGIKTAQSIISGASQPTSTPAGNVSDITDPKIRAILEGMAGTAGKLETKLASDAAAIGYSYNPSTGTVTPVQQQQQIQQQQIQQQQQQIQTTAVNLAEQEFINTLKLLMGSAEASKPYIKQLYTLTSKYYKTGSSIADAVNLALYDAQENKLIPEFTSRFSGIFKIQARRAAGEIIDVPTLSEYIKSQEVLADVFRQTSLGELANETFLN